MNKLPHSKFFSQNRGLSCSLYSHSPVHTKNRKVKSCVIRTAMLVLSEHLWMQYLGKIVGAIYLLSLIYILQFNIFIPHFKLQLKYSNNQHLPADGTSCWEFHWVPTMPVLGIQKLSLTQAWSRMRGSSFLACTNLPPIFIIFCAAV